MNESRLRASHACAAIGVVLLIVATVMPWEWYPAVPLFSGLALLCVSHVLTPCQDQITRWWRGRITK